MLNRLQVEDPKTLFTVLKHLAKLTKKARIAVEFRRERPEQVPPDAGPLAPHASIADHIQDLFGQLPASEGQPELEPFEKVRNYVSTADVNEALTRTGNKATGLDQLPVQLLKQPHLRELVLERCRASFNDWVNASKVPSYCKEAKVFALSKEETDFPRYGNVRTISVLPGVYKVFEKVVLKRLQEHLQEHPLNEAQCGFTPGRSTLHNVDQLVSLITRAKDYARAERRRTKKVASRNRQFVVFVDLKKAFDSVDRRKLVATLQKKGFDPLLVGTISNMLTGTVMNYEGQPTETFVGVPQGAITSPTLFNVYIDGLVDQLAAANTRTLAFADDIAFFAKDRKELDASFKAIEDWSARYGIHMNCAKSGVMAVRVDRRTPMLPVEKVRGVPVVSQYKYLGLVLDDCGDLKPLNQTLKATLRSYKQQVSMSWAHKFPAKLKLLAWASLLRSKVLYGLFCVAGKSRPVAATVRTFLYSSVKHLLGIRSRPKADTLFQAAFGTSCENLVELHVHRQAVQLGRADFDQDRHDALLEAKQHLKNVMKLDLSSTVAFLCGRLVNPYQRKKRLLCPCKALPLDEHWTSCRTLHDKLKQDPKLRYKLDGLLKQLRNFQNGDLFKKLVLAKSFVLGQTEQTLRLAKKAVHGLLR